MTNSKTETSVKNGIKILTRAIKKKISLSEASRQSGFGRNYVSDIKARIKDNYKNKNVSKEMYSEFNNLMKQYTR
jgi:hypothetical protein